MDAYANGLAVKPNGTQPADSVERAGTQSTFDGGWEKAKTSEATNEVVQRRRRLVRARLQLLINTLKGSGT